MVHGLRMQRGQSLSKCERCGGRCQVLESRNRPLGKYRRRKCVVCNHRFSTIEVTASDARLVLRMARMIAGFAEVAPALGAMAAALNTALGSSEAAEED